MVRLGWQAGNLVNQTMNDKETYDAILPLYKLKPENPRQRDSRLYERLVTLDTTENILFPSKLKQFRSYLICEMGIAVL